MLVVCVNLNKKVYSGCATAFHELGVTLLIKVLNNLADEKRPLSEMIKFTTNEMYSHKVCVRVNISG